MSSNLWLVSALSSFGAKLKHVGGKKSKHGVLNKELFATSVSELLKCSCLQDEWPFLTQCDPSLTEGETSF